MVRPLDELPDTKAAKRACPLLSSRARCRGQASPSMSTTLESRLRCEGWPGGGGGERQMVAPACWRSESACGVHQPALPTAPWSFRLWFGGRWRRLLAKHSPVGSAACCLQALAQIKTATGQSTVPQIFVGGRLLGGASDVIPLVERGELQQLLAAASAPPLPAELEAVVEQACAAASRAAAESAATSDSPEQAQLRELAAGLRDAKGGSPGAAFALQVAAQWLQAARGLSPGAAAAALGDLQAAQLVTVVDPGLSPETALNAQLLQARPQLRLQMAADAPQPAKWSEPLNGQFVWFGPARPAAEVRGGKVA